MLSILLSLLLLTSPKISIHTLDNGLRVVFVEDKTLPVFLGFVQFNTGAADEAPGLTGVSHLLEHMLFKGTKKLGTTNYRAEEKINNQIERLYEILDTLKDGSKIAAIRDSINKLTEELKKYIVSEEIWRIYSEHGGTMMNASTSNVSTQYYVMLPSNKKELWFKIESDRFKNLVLREFFSERDVVNEERRMGDSNPYERIWDALMASVYTASPLRWPVIGWEDDIMNVKPHQVMWYYKTHYTPDNCIIVLVGDVDPEKDLKLVKKYFGDWKGKKFNLNRYTSDPEENATKRVKLYGPGMPTMAIGVKGPYYPDREYFALSIFAYIFGGFESSILKKDLVERGLIVNGESFAASWDGKGQSLFGIYLYPAKGVTMDSLEKAIFAVLDSIKTTGINERFIEKAKNNYKMYYVMRQRDFLSLAFTIGRGVRLFNDPEFYKKELEIIDSITSEEIIEAIKKYISKDKATIVTLGG